MPNSEGMDQSFIGNEIMGYPVMDKDIIGNDFVKKDGTTRKVVGNEVYDRETTARAYFGKIEAIISKFEKDGLRDIKNGVSLTELQEIFEILQWSETPIKGVQIYSGSNVFQDFFTGTIENSNDITFKKRDIPPSDFGKAAEYIERITTDPKAKLSTNQQVFVGSCIDTIKQNILQQPDHNEKALGYASMAVGMCKNKLIPNWDSASKNAS